MAYRGFLPYAALISFSLFLIFLWVNQRHVKDIFKEIGKRAWFLLIFLFIFALGLRLIIPPLQHIMYVDEPWYMEAAKNILQTFHQGSYPKSIGWPFLLVISFFLFGVSNKVAIYTTVVLGALTVLIIFFLAYIITKSKTVSFFSAAIFALLPLHIRWAATAETNVPSLFFITLSLCFCFLCYKKQNYSLFWLALFSLIFTSLIRPENYLLFPLFLAGFFIFKVKINLKQVLLAILITSVLVVPAVFQSISFQTSANWLEKESQQQLQGNNWSISNLVNNSIDFGPDIFNREKLPFFISFLSIVGFIYIFFTKPKETYFLVFWFVFLWVAYFSAWFQTLGGKDRFYLSFYPSVIIFAGYSLKFFSELLYRVRLKKKLRELVNFFLISLLILWSFPYALKAKNIYASSAARLATKLPRLAEKNLPSEAIIIANWPTVLRSTTNLNVVDANLFLFDYNLQRELLESKKLVLFLEGYFCLGSVCSWSEEICKLIKNGFELIPYKEFKEKDVWYIFYEVGSRI